MEGKRTPLYEVHKNLGAEMIEFAGFLMPLGYDGIKEEVIATRKTAGLFDISHMGRIVIEGARAKEFLQEVITNDVQKLKPGRALYTLFCQENGGVIDDLILYQGFHPQTFILVINACNFQKDLDWLKRRASQMKIKIEDITEKQPMIALQGPNSLKIMERAGAKIKRLRYFRWKSVKILNKIWAIVSRIGYTGEDGFEIIVLSKDVVELWQSLLKIGQEFGLKPAGLAARDTLRLEAGLPLYGHELSEKITPLETGLERFISFEKGDFIGKEALLKQKKEGVKKKLVGFEVIDGRMARYGYPIFNENEEIGWVTSGTLSPTLSRSLGMGFVNPGYAFPGNIFEIDIRGQRHQAKVVKLPFYKRGKKGGARS